MLFGCVKCWQGRPIQAPLCSEMEAAESAPAADSAALAGVPPPVPKEFPLPLKQDKGPPKVDSGS
jgi:hypothetical protein